MNETKRDKMESLRCKRDIKSQTSRTAKPLIEGHRHPPRPLGDVLAVKHQGVRISIASRQNIPFPPSSIFLLNRACLYRRPIYLVNRVSVTYRLLTESKRDARTLQRKAPTWHSTTGHLPNAAEKQLNR